MRQEWLLATKTSYDKHYERYLQGKLKTQRLNIAQVCRNVLLSGGSGSKLITANPVPLGTATDYIQSKDAAVQLFVKTKSA